MPQSVHHLASRWQAGPTHVTVLTPDDPRYAPWATLYVLPVECGTYAVFGSGISEVLRSDLHNRYRLVCVAPTFSDIPWYADHPHVESRHQERHFLSVVELIEHTYPVRRQTADRHLVGFSKSGWGAYSLLLRHPDVFGRAVAWDSPFDLDVPWYPGVQEIFHSQENFDLFRPILLLGKVANRLGPTARLGLHGYGDFREDHEHLHARLQSLGIPHDYRDRPRRDHVWGSGWLPDAVHFLAHDSSPCLTLTRSQASGASGIAFSPYGVCVGPLKPPEGGQAVERLHVGDDYGESQETACCRLAGENGETLGGHHPGRTCGLQVVADETSCVAEGENGVAHRINPCHQAPTPRPQPKGGS